MCGRSQARCLVAGDRSPAWWPPQQAACTAWHALPQVRDKLGSAPGWSTYDTYFGGGPISSLIKHSRLDEAAHAAVCAGRCLAVLQTELADVPGVALTVPQLAVNGLARFVNVWFDNILPTSRYEIGSSKRSRTSPGPGNWCAKCKPGWSNGQSRYARDSPRSTANAAFSSQQ